MGLGYALSEQFIMDQGKTLNTTFLDYKMPHAVDMPPGESLANYINAKTGIDVKAIVLGYIQRGGQPTTGGANGAFAGACSRDRLMSFRFDSTMSERTSRSRMSCAAARL